VFFYLLFSFFLVYPLNYYWQLLSIFHNIIKITIVSKILRECKKTFISKNLYGEVC